jgi:hypothetical protein
MCSEVEAGNFRTLVHGVLMNVGKSVLKMKEAFCKSSFIIANDV